MKQKTAWTIDRDYVSAERWASSGWVIRDERQRHVCTINNATLDAESKSHLIAAAPELLHACKLALAAFEKNHAIDWGDVAAAIAKAEGRTA